MPQVRALDFPRRIPRRSQNHIIDRHAHRQKLAHDFEQAHHPCVHAGRVQVGRDRVRNEAGLHHRNRRGPPEAPAAVADIEDDSSLTSVDHGLARTLRHRILLAADAAVGVGVDVARAEILVQQVVHGAPGRDVSAEIDHHRDVGELAHLLGLFIRCPFAPVEMRALDADDEPLVSQRHVRRGLDLHVRQVLFDRSRAHSGADDIEKRRDAGFRSVDHTRLEVIEGAPARAAGVGHRRDATAEREAVGRQAQVPSGVGIGLLAVVDVDVDVDEARSDIEARDIDGSRRLRRRNVHRDRGNLLVLDRHVPNGADPVPAVDDVAALQEQIVVGLGASQRHEAHRDQNDGHRFHRVSPEGPGYYH